MTVDRRSREDRPPPVAAWPAGERGREPLPGNADHRADQRDETDLTLPPPAFAGWPRVYPGL